ncbi:MAG: hypothetical protein WCH43_07445 [Verrucomicrobiota bacterium]
MKTLTLLAPDFSALDTIWRNPLPFALWPVGHQSLLAHWMDEAVRQGATEVRIFAADRPSEIRQHLDGGAYWSRKVEVVAIKQDNEAPAEAIPVIRLPEQPEPAAPFSTPGELLTHWLGIQRFWLSNRDSHSVAVDVETVPDGWIGPLARVHPRATLKPPFWIGARAEIGGDCVIGPNALIGAECVLDGNAQVEDAVVMPGTFLGRNTRLHRAVAQGGILVDVQRGCRVDIRESFILGTVAQHRASTTPLEKMAALVLWVFLAPVAKFWPGQTWESREVTCSAGFPMTLATGTHGPLIVRRWPWLRSVTAGQLCWFGILPRTESDWQHLPSETAERLKSSPPGLFSWADLQGCHETSAPDEWIHAAYQVLQQDGTVRHLLRRSLMHLALTRPNP